MDKIGWNWMKVDNNGLKWIEWMNMAEKGMKVYEGVWKCMKLDERGWKCMNTYETRWKWMKWIKVDEMDQSRWMWTWYMADAHVHAVTINSNTRSYTLRSAPSSPGRSFLTSPTTGIQLVMLELKLLHGKPCSAAEEVSPGQNCYNWPDLGFKTSNLGEWLDFDERNIFPKKLQTKKSIYIPQH